MVNKVLTISMLFLFSGVLLAQQGSLQKQLSLQDCINIALHKNTNVVQAQYNAQSQNARVLSAYGQLLPQLSATGQFSWQRSQISTGVLVGGVLFPFNQTTQSRRWQANVGADYTLFNGFANYAGIDQANSASEAAGFSLDRTKQTAAYQTTVDYLGVFNARDQLKISEDNLKRDQQQLETIKKENSVGSASIADVYTQQATVSADESALIQAKNAYDQASAALKYYLGIPVTDSVEFADPTIVTQIDTTQFPVLNERYRQIADLLGTALKSRPDYNAAVQNVSASKSQLSVAEAQYSPTIGAFAQYGISGPGVPQINQNKNLYAGLSLSLPIFNGFQTQTNIQVADVAVKSAKETLDATKRQVQLDIFQGLLNLYASEKQYEAGINQVASAKINLETEQEKYSIGSATLLDVLTANALYTSALSSRVMAAYSFIQAKQQIEYAIGTLKY